MNDQFYMARALRLAKKGLYTASPNPRVGCVLVRDDAVIGEGWHRRTGDAHAEIVALNSVVDFGHQHARAATAYVTLEPCSHHGRTPPCVQALIAAGITRVVVAMVDPNPKVAGSGIKQLEAAGIQVDVAVCEQDARELNVGFIKRMTQNKPLVRCKLAMSLDGRTAMASGESQWITSKAARHDVQYWRARSDAVLTGIGTVLADDPRLTVRGEFESCLDAQPLRVVADSGLRTPADARLFVDADGDVLVMTAEGQDVPPAYPAEVHGLALKDGRLDLGQLMTELARREINEVHVEAGAQLSGALLQAGLVDELLIYMAPMLMGSSARGLLDMPGLDQLSDALALDIFEIRAVGSDVRIRARVN